ncbi:MAG: four helix bundle protein [Gemmatimonadetes bacterium]|nr:MAG: four helix bundle protein [Gemmatimonadota bacterium]
MSQTIERFEQIQAWQKARGLTRQVYSITQNRTFTKDFSLKDQLRRASNSIMLNIAEGFALLYILLWVTVIFRNQSFNRLMMLQVRFQK